MTQTACREDIPEPILDQAFHWAVVLGSGTASDADHQAFQEWLAQDPMHQAAWQRIQIIDQDFAAARTAATTSASVLRSVTDQRRRERRLAVGGPLLLMLMLGLGFKVASNHYHWETDYATAIGEQQRVELTGDAIVHLSSRTRVDIATSDSGIEVRLYRGEILVDSGTAAKQSRPRVATEDGVFTPIGTRFVIAYKGGVTNLAVLNGQVAVKPDHGGREIQVNAKEKVRVADGRVEALAPSGLTPGVWTEEIVDADNARLGDVLDALAEYRRGWLRYDAAVAELRVTGVFHLDDIDNALRTLEHSLPVKIDRTTDWWVTVKAKDQS